MARRIYMCSGSDCKKRKSIRKKIRALLVAAGLKKQLQKVGCQKVCKGPVVGLEVDGRLEWFGRLTEDDAEALIAMAYGESLPARLERKRAKKRSGKLRD